MSHQLSKVLTTEVKKMIASAPRAMIAGIRALSSGPVVSMTGGPGPKLRAVRHAPPGKVRELGELVDGGRPPPKP